MKRLQERGRLGCKFLRAEVVGFIFSSHLVLFYSSAYFLISSNGFSKLQSPAHPWTFVDASLKDAPRGRTVGTSMCYKNY